MFAAKIYLAVSQKKKKKKKTMENVHCNVSIPTQCCIVIIILYFVRENEKSPTFLRSYIVNSFDIFEVEQTFSTFFLIFHMLCACIISRQHFNVNIYYFLLLKLCQQFCRILKSAICFCFFVLSWRKLRHFHAYASVNSISFSLSLSLIFILPFKHVTN